MSQANSSLRSLAARTRTKIACDRCRDKKKKCCMLEGQDTCKACSDVNEGCTFNRDAKDNVPYHQQTQQQLHSSTIPSTADYNVGIVTLQNFSKRLALEGPMRRLEPSFWTSLHSEFFAPSAEIILNGKRLDALEFFLDGARRDVFCMNISMNGAEEQLTYPNHREVKCADVSWKFEYIGGYFITFKGPARVRLALCPTGSVYSHSIQAPDNWRISCLIFWSKEQESNAGSMGM